MLGLVYFPYNKLSKIMKEQDKFTKLLLKRYLQLNKKDFGEDTFISGLIMPYLKNKLHKISKKLIRFMKG